MNPIEDLATKLSTQFPDLISTMDIPDESSSSWWLDLNLKGHIALVEWRPKQGFGVSSSDSQVYGEGPDEIYSDVDSTLKRVTEVLKGRLRTVPPQEIVLQKLREYRVL